jgi:hypothetical protein
MGELLRRGFDAQPADRNTKGYDIPSVWRPTKLCVKYKRSVRSQPWHVSRSVYLGEGADQVTIYCSLVR